MVIKPADDIWTKVAAGLLIAAILGGVASWRSFASDSDLQDQKKKCAEGRKELGGDVGDIKEAIASIDASLEILVKDYKRGKK